MPYFQCRIADGSRTHGAASTWPFRHAPRIYRVRAAALAHHHVPPVARRGARRCRRRRRPGQHERPSRKLLDDGRRCASPVLFLSRPRLRPNAVRARRTRRVGLTARTRRLGSFRKEMWYHARHDQHRDSKPVALLCVGPDEHSVVRATTRSILLPRPVPRPLVLEPPSCRLNRSSLPSQLEPVLGRHPIVRRALPATFARRLQRGAGLSAQGGRALLPLLGLLARQQGQNAPVGNAPPRLLHRASGVWGKKQLGA